MSGQLLVFVYVHGCFEFGFRLDISNYERIRMVYQCHRLD